MKLKKYQKKAVKQAKYPGSIWFPTLGVCGELGELTAAYYEGNDMAILDESGDVLWYLANLCNDLGLDLEAIATGINPREQYQYGSMLSEGAVIAEAVKKLFRDGFSSKHDLRIQEAIKSIICILDYLAKKRGHTLKQVARNNFNKMKEKFT